MSQAATPHVQAKCSPTDLTAFSTKHAPRSYTNASIHFHRTYTQQDRLQAAMDARWNVFQFPSEMLSVDLLSDSGTTTLTVEQRAKLLLGDEAYGSNRGYFELLEQIEDTFGIQRTAWETFLFHQGRAAEHALFSQLRKTWEGNNRLIIPNNGHFDTTRANIEVNGFEARDLFSPTLYSGSVETFKGNMDVHALEKLLEEHADRVPLVYITITNNTGGGQPVSLKNLHKVRALCDRYNKALFLDACRFAENAWFIQKHEKIYAGSSISDIVHEMFSLCDGCTISFKKDGLSNMGGALFLKKDSPLTCYLPKLINAIRDHQILVEGHPTYGGLAGRDLLVIAEGLRTVTQEVYLNSRIHLVHSFGEALQARGIPILTPFGGHAIYIDTDRFFEDTQHEKGDFGGIVLAALLLLKGIRLCELGAFAFGSVNSKTGKDCFPKQNFVRCAIPRNAYELSDLLYVADCIEGLYNRRHQLPRAKVTEGHVATLRHFKAQFELV